MVSFPETYNDARRLVYVRCIWGQDLGSPWAHRTQKVAT